MSRVPVALRAEVDLERGGRWTSLRGGEREWLWARNEPRRAGVSVRDPFADAGGLEECIPTVRGVPDHGDVWSRRWSLEDETASVDTGSFRLQRSVSEDDGAVVANYRFEGEPGYRFLWAAHALLDLSTHAQIVFPSGSETRLYNEARPYVTAPWPDGAPWVTGAWPDPAGFRMDTTGPEDGTAVGASVGPWRESARVEIRDGEDLLEMELHATGQPVSIALWRNLGGFPEQAPYRSIGVEPMLGIGFDLDQCGDEEVAIAPASGVVGWRLTMRAFRRQR